MCLSCKCSSSVRSEHLVATLKLFAVVLYLRAYCSENLRMPSKLLSSGSTGAATISLNIRLYGPAGES